MICNLQNLTCFNSKVSTIECKIRDRFSSVSPSLIPFKIIEIIAHQCYSPFLEQFMSNYHPKETSCILTMKAVCLIYFKEERRKQIFDQLKAKISISLNITFKETLKFEYLVQDLFSGIPIKKFDKIHSTKPFSLKSFSENYLKFSQKQIDTYHEYIKNSILPNIDQNLPDSKIRETTNNLFKSLAFDFNKPAFDKLKKEFEKNTLVVSPECSFIYCCTLLRTEITSQNAYYHAFAIEQFFYEDQVYYRIYQSCIDEFTLSEYMRDKNYGKTPVSGCFTHEEFMQFYQNLVLGCSNSPNSEHCREVCFNLPKSIARETLDLVKFNSQARSLGGISFRYLSTEIHPKDCLENFINLIKKNRHFAEKVDHLI